MITLITKQYIGYTNNKQWYYNTWIINDDTNIKQ